MTDNADTGASKDWAQEIVEVRDRLERLRDDVPVALIDDEDIKGINRFLSFMTDWAHEARDKQEKRAAVESLQQSDGSTEGGER